MPGSAAIGQEICKESSFHDMMGQLEFYKPITLNRPSISHLKLIGQQVHGAENAVEMEDDLEYQEGDAAK